MANRKKKTAKKRAKKPTFWEDERKSKIVGLFFLLFSVFLTVAFVSYIFTWRADQDEVMNLSLSFFQADVDIKNALGKLGAYMSHALIYWGFGVGAFLTIPLCADFGWLVFHRKPLQPFFVRLFNVIFVVAVVSVIAGFAFRSSAFAWGGAFGDAMVHWLTNFIGQIGLFFLLLALTTSYFIWLFNFNVREFSFSSMKNSVNWKWSFASFKSAVTNFLEDKEEVDLEKPATLRPTGEQQTMEFKFEEEVPMQTAPAPKPAPKEKPATLQPNFGVKENLLFEINEEEEKAPEPEVKQPDAFETIDAKKVKKEQKTEASDQLEIMDPHTHAPVQKLSVQEEEKAPLEAYDPSLDLSRFEQPTLDLLISYEEGNVEIDRSELEENKNQIITTLLNYKIEITKIRATIGPTVTLYEIVPAPGVRISKIKNLEDDIALSLSALGIRIIAPIPGKGTIGIEVPNKRKQTVSLQEVLKSPKFSNSKMTLPIALGKTIANEVFVADLAKMPHLLVAGATGQGKSVGINAILMSLLYKKHPSQLKLVLIDPKKVELFPYSKLLKHYLAVLPGQDEPIITDTKKVIYTLNSLCIEMDDRYDLLKKARSRNLKEYNAKFVERKLNPNEGHKYLPLIVLVIDEFADLIMTAGKEVEMPIGRLAQLARAVGIHLIIATQRPSVNIITGIIKANFPARMAYKVTSKIDSRTILDAGGAEQLIGRGDMLLSVGGDMVRLQCAFVDTPEVERVIDFIGDQQGYGEPHYLPEYLGDDATAGNSDLKVSELDSMFEEAAMLVAASQSGSTSMIQRKLKLGYNRAGRIMDQLEALGIVGPSQGSKPREVLVHGEHEMAMILEDIKTMG